MLAMAEEQECLVRARSDSDNSSKVGSFGSLRTMAYTEDRLAGTEGGGEPGTTAAMAQEHSQDTADSGDLIDYNDSGVLEQFHEDALRQAGCGLSQAQVILATGIGVAGSSLELSAIPFILPSAEIELCILPHEKNWLVMISVCGCALGAVGWGVLSERLGRRRALLSCLAVNAVFAAIAAFMPTYGTFMMARFCSAIGSGGIIPTCYTYVGEMVPRTCRRKALAWLAGASGLGALCSAALARAVLPLTGADALIEDKEHFSAWHRYLLFCTLPILASLVSLIWTQESPRYLLDVGREVDAMLVYQNIHGGNQIRLCGKSEGGSGSCDGEYRLGELALPGKRRPPALHHVRHSVKMFWQAFFQLFSNAHRSTTLSLGGTLVLTMVIQFFLSSYVPATVEKLDKIIFDASKQTIENVTFEHEYYNKTIENIDYNNVTFYNCTFRDMLMSHVDFRNTSFVNVAMSNIKTSYTNFKDCLFLNSTVIDTDLWVGVTLGADCALRGSVVRGVRAACPRRGDAAARLAAPLAARGATAAAALLAALLAAPLAPNHALLCAACALLSPSLYFTVSETGLYVVEAILNVFLTLVFFNVAVTVIDSYPSNLRCMCHGLILSAAYMCCLPARSVNAGPLFAAVVCTVFSAVAALIASAR